MIDRFGTKLRIGQGPRLLSGPARSRLRRQGEAIEQALSGAVEAATEMLRRRQVRATGLFDPAFYLAANPDVAASGIDPLHHYVNLGGQQLRNPNPLFDAASYAAANPDVPSVYGNLPIHYHRQGAWSGRDPHWLFDTEWYARAHPGLRDAGTNPLAHYLSVGASQGHDPHPLFDSDWYLAKNPDVAAREMNPLVHYLSEGAAERRDPHPLFDTAWVLAQGRPIPADANPLAYYLAAGAREGRTPNRLFDAGWYLAHNPDIAALCLNPLLHYAVIGASEDRNPGPYFDAAWYRARYRDAAASGLQPLAHYLAFGAAEGRDPDPFFARNRAAGLAAAEDDAGPAAAISVVAYACATGPGKRIPAIARPDQRVRYLLFTDDEAVRSRIWEVRILRDALSTPARTAALPKILAHRYLPAHDVSVCIDASFDLAADDLIRLAHDGLADRDVAVCGPAGDGEVEASAPGEASAGAAAQPGTQFPATQFVVRRNTPEVRSLNEKWWNYFSGEDDAGALATALNEVSVDNRTIPAELAVSSPARRGAESRQSEAAGEQRLFIFIAYAPAGYNGDLGRTYNDYMSLLGPGDYALFLDHDAMFCHPNWRDCIMPLVAGYCGQAALFVSRTNRIGMAYQRVAALQHEHRVAPHRAFAESLADERDWLIDVTHMPPSSGVVMMLSKATWEKNKFAAGFLGVDNRFHRALRAKKGRILLPQAAYVYHFYRADGDETHALRLPRKIEHAADAHPVKNFAYDESAGLHISGYMDLISDGDWAVLIRNRSMFCEKNWYVRASGFAETCADSEVVVFNSNRLDGGAGDHDDLLLHRRYAAECADAHDDALTPEPQFGPQHLAAFMISKRFYAELGLSGSVSVERLCRALQDRGESLQLARGIYVYVQPEASEEGESGDRLPLAAAEGRPDGSHAIRQRQRRVALLVAGPHQAGMDTHMHELAEALTAAGHLVTMFSPKPRAGFTEAAHSYMLRRHRNAVEFQTQFRAHQNTFPFDLIVAEDPLQTASMAVGMKRRYGIPVAVKVDESHLLADPATGMRDLVLTENLARADCAIVTGPHSCEALAQIFADMQIRRIDENGDLAAQYESVMVELLNPWQPWYGPGKRLV